MEDVVGFSKVQIIGFIGVALLVIGCFTPLFSASFLGTSISISLLGSGKPTENGIIILAGTLISCILIFTSRLKWLYLSGGLLGAIIAYIFITVQSVFSDISSGGNSYSQITSGMIKLDIGWAFLFCGAIFLIATPYISGKIGKNQLHVPPNLESLKSLEKLDELRGKGIVSDEEFNRQKESILHSISDKSDESKIQGDGPFPVYAIILIILVVFAATIGIMTLSRGGSSSDSISTVTQIKNTPTVQITRIITVATPTPRPTYKVASVTNGQFSLDPTTNTIYQFNGNMVISRGAYEDVVIILRYPNYEEFSYDIGAMGGSNFTNKEFKVILNDRVKKLVPKYFVKLDGKEYPAETISTKGSIFNERDIKFEVYLQD